MFKMTLLLAVSVYAGLIIWGDPLPTAPADPSTGRDAAPVADAADYARPVILDRGGAGGPEIPRAATSRVVVPESAALAAGATAEAEAAPGIGEPRLVSLLPPDAESGSAAAAPPPSTDGQLRVSGDRVNMRAGPSTADAVVESLAGGTLAEPLGEPVDGWQEIRVVETGQTGFMAARFLDPA